MIYQKYEYKCTIIELIVYVFTLMTLSGSKLDKSGETLKLDST